MTKPKLQYDDENRIMDSTIRTIIQGLLQIAHVDDIHGENKTASRMISYVIDVHNDEIARRQIIAKRPAITRAHEIVSKITMEKTSEQMDAELMEKMKDINNKYTKRRPGP